MSQPDDSMIEESPRRGNKTLIVMVILVVAAVAVGFLIWALRSDDDELATSETTAPPTTSEAPATTAPPTTAPATTVPETTVPETTAPPTTAPATTTPATAPPTAPPTAPTTTVPADPVSEAVWPLVDSDVRYADPVDAARGTAVDFVGFTELVVGEFMAGDNRSGEVELRAGNIGPVTVVLLRQLTDDDSWWVIGSATDNIVVDTPEPLSTITSPLTVSGRARAFEGTVNVELRADGAEEPVTAGFVTGSGDAELGPFAASFEFDQPGVPAGALVLLTFSAEDGRVVEASVTRLFFDAD